LFRRRIEARERLLRLIERFRERGATSPESAKTLEELGLPPSSETPWRDLWGDWVFSWRLMEGIISLKTDCRN